MFFWFVTLLLVDPAFTIKQTFQPPPEDLELVQPFASCFANNQQLYVLDPSQSKILVWKSNGQFSHSFSRQGLGPGELEQPIQLAAWGDHLYVWQFNGRVTEFSLDGAYRSNFTFKGPWPRRFTMLDSQRALINYRRLTNQGQGYYHFEIRDRSDNVVAIKAFHNPGFLGVKPGRNRAEIWGYMADVDIQADPKGGWWFGFGYEKKLHHLTPDGHIDTTASFDLPKRKPTQEEREAIENELIDMGQGRFVKVKDLPDLKIHLDVPKAYFTQFLVTHQKVAFVLTPNGGSDGVGDGAASATFIINSLSDGTLLSHGKYSLPEESQVHYRNGRIMVFELNGSGDFDIYEATLKGLE